MDASDGYPSFYATASANTSTRAGWVGGYPRVTLRDTQGTALDLTYRHGGGEWSEPVTAPRFGDTSGYIVAMTVVPLGDARDHLSEC